MLPHVNIAIVDDIRENAEQRQRAIESKTDWPTLVSTEIFSNADDLIDAFEREGKFFDVIFTDVFMRRRGEDVRKDDSPEDGAIYITEWLRRKRESDDDFKYVQLRWISRHSDVSPFIHKHVNARNYSWLGWISHHKKASFLTVDFLIEVERAIRMAQPYSADADVPANFIFASPAMMEVVKLAKQVAASQVTVLIDGESGTGKDVLAKYIHDNSTRSECRWVPFNCAAVPSDLIESELLGHKKGGFTTAHADKVGLIESADNGTLFLDEVGDMPANMQVKLLRVLEQKAFQPVGHDHRLPSKKSDFRLVCATNKNLNEEVAAGRFRGDLYYRINTVRITIPPLRERLEDVQPQAEYFARFFAQRENKGYITLSDAVIDRLKRYNWPGNVRELRNVMERAVVLSGLNGQITMNDLPDEIRGESNAGTTTPLSPEEHLRYNALKNNGFNLSRAAKSLGISRQALEQYITKTKSDGTPLHQSLKRLYEEGKRSIDRQAQTETTSINDKQQTGVSVKVEENF